MSYLKTYLLYAFLYTASTGNIIANNQPDTLLQETLITLAHIIKHKSVSPSPALQQTYRLIETKEPIPPTVLATTLKDAECIVAPLPDSNEKKLLLDQLKELAMRVPSYLPVNDSSAEETLYTFVDNAGNIGIGNASTSESLTSGTQNTFIGANAGKTTTIGNNNTALGYQAFVNNIFGNDNTALGNQAARSNTSGDENTAVGVEAMYYNRSGDQNTASGYRSLYNNLSGNDNTAHGHKALHNNIGNSNTAIGSQALYGNTSGNNNTAVGYLSMFNSSTGGSNTALGHASLYANGSGFNNAAIGQKSLYSNTTGFNNTALGSLAMQSNTTGMNNTALGSSTLSNNISGQQNIAVGQSALSTNITGSNNVALGYQALLKNTSFENVAIGNTAMSLNTTATHNTAVGYNALATNRRSPDNTAMGYRSLELATGPYNTAHGARSLQKLTSGTKNIALGFNAGSTLTSNESYNIYIGNVGASKENQTIRLGTTSTHTSCYIAGNVTLPTGTLYINQGGINVGNGNFTVDNAGNISSSTATSGVFNPYDLEVQHNLTVNNYTRMKGNAAVDGTLTANYLTVNHDMTLNGLELNNRLSLPFLSADSLGITGALSGLAGTDYVGIGVDSDGHVGTTSNWTIFARRHEDDTEDLTQPIPAFQQLRPVTFPAQKGVTSITHVGLIPAEVAPLFPHAVSFDNDHKARGVDYQQLTPVIINEVQQHEKRLAALEETVANLDKMLSQLASLEVGLSINKQKTIPAT